MNSLDRAAIVNRAKHGVAFPSDVLALDAALTAVESGYTSTWQPGWTVPPGETLLELLGMRGWTQAHLARESGWSLKHINQVVKGHKGISVRLALKLEALDFASAKFWLNREVDYRLDLARLEK